MGVKPLFGKALVVGASLAVTSAAVAQPDGGAGPPTNVIPACMHVTTESRYAPYGYSHIVILKNGCSKAATCSVATDVNPQTQTVDVAAGQTTEVTTFFSAATSQFVARVNCRLK